VRLDEFIIRSIFFLTENYHKDTTALRGRTKDTSLENITVLPHSAVIQGKRSNVHSNLCVWLLQLVILGKYDGNSSI
jgi:hypothetical protein